MTTLIKTDGQYIVKPGDSLSKISSQQGITLAELLASNPQYSKNPNLIHPGDVVKTGPSYNNLVNTGGNTSSGGPTKISATDLITKLMKDRQGSANTYTGNTAALLTGGENIAKTNADLYSQDLQNANISNADRLALLGGDTGVQDPALKSIESQQRMNEARYNAEMDRIEAEQDQYNKEQDRIFEEKQNALDRASGPKLTQTERYNEILSSYANGFESGGMLEDGVTPIKAPSGYLTLAAWQSALNDARKKGITKKDFILQYGDYLNPNMLADYGLTGVEQAYITKPKSESSAETEAIINAILGQ